MIFVIEGRGWGPQGHSWAIPTKDKDLKTLPLNAIQEFVWQFLADARNHPELEFQVIRIGCGLAGYNDADIAPMFKNAPDNCLLPRNWRLIQSQEVNNG